MKNFLKIVFGILSVLWLSTAQANLYKVENVPVEAEKSSALAAKEAALAEGQMLAFKRLITRLAPENKDQLPQVTLDEVLACVLGVSIENEKTTATKYMGSIAVEFNPTMVKEFLNNQQVSYLSTQAPSLLVIPEYIVGENTQTLESTNPLYNALKDKKDFAPFYQAVVPQGTLDELEMIRQNKQSAINLLPVYHKDQVMVLRLEDEGNDMWGIRSIFYPSTGMQNQVVYKRFRVGSGNQEMAAAQMAEAVFKEMERRWRTDRTTSFSDKQTLYLRINVRSLDEWIALEQKMKKWSFFENMALKGIYLPQVLVEVTYKDDESKIRNNLWDNGWQLTRDVTGNGATLTKVGNNE